MNRTIARRNRKRLGPGSMPFVFDLIGLNPVRGTWRLLGPGGYTACNGLAAHYVRKSLECGRTVQWAVGDFECLHRPHLALAIALGLSLPYTLGFAAGWDGRPEPLGLGPGAQLGHRDGLDSLDSVRDRVVTRGPIVLDSEFLRGALTSHPL